MQTILNLDTLLPNQQSYNIAPWNYTGDETLDSIPADMVLTTYVHPNRVDMLFIYALTPHYSSHLVEIINKLLFFGHLFSYHNEVEEYIWQDSNLFSAYYH